MSLLSKRYFRYRMKKLTNCQYSEESSKARFQRDNGGSERVDGDDSHEDDNNNTFHNNGDDSEDDGEFNIDNSSNINVYGVHNYVADDIDICEVENSEMEDDFSTSHLARWCKTVNVPTTHVNTLLKDIKKHKCFKTVFPLDARSLLGTPRSTSLKTVPPGEYYHQGLVNGLVRVLSKYDIENIDLTLNIDGLPLSYIKYAINNYLHV